jgi:hypothetical protein
MARHSVSHERFHKNISAVSFLLIHSFINVKHLELNKMTGSAITHGILVTFIPGIYLVVCVSKFHGAVENHLVSFS